MRKLRERIMTPAALEELKQGCGRASKEWWKHEEPGYLVNGEEALAIIIKDTERCEQAWNDAEYICAANPHAVLELIRALEIETRKNEAGRVNQALVDSSEIAIKGLQSEIALLKGQVQEARRGWQPIETAPKFKTVLVYHGYKVWVAYKTNHESEIIDTWRHQDGTQLGWPTHWMPLPLSPGSDAGEGK